MTEVSRLPEGREDMMSKQTNCNFDPAAKCPLWLAFGLMKPAGAIKTSFAISSSARGVVSQRPKNMFFIVVGPGGTGKSTFQETLAYVWGDYCVD